jgi:hypothetical protein
MTRLAAALAAALVLAGPAAGADVRVVVVPRFDPAAYAPRGAVGLLVPGAGAEVTRAGALAALERGRVRNSLLGGKPTGRVLVRPSSQPGAVTFYVALPPPGRHHNVVRYPIAVVGGGYRGLLTSVNTRIPGLLSIADIAPSVVDLRAGSRPDVRWRASSDAARELRRLDDRLTHSHDTRAWANLVLGTLLSALALLALLLRSRFLGRAAALAVPTVLLAALAVSALAITRPSVAAIWIGVLAAVGSLAAAGAVPDRRAFAAALLLVFPIMCVVLATSTETNSLAALGPHPDGGGRYYGITNQVETLLVAPALLGAALLGRRWLVPVALLAAVTVGAAATGADGGGVVVLTAGFLALWLRLSGVRLTLARLVAIGAGALLLGLALVGIDAAAGGSSHVTRALGGGPGDLLSSALHRLNESVHGVVGSLNAAIVFAIGVVGLLWLASRRPRSSVLDAFLVAIAVSLLVNDTPRDVTLYGFFAGATLFVSSRLDDVEAGLSRDREGAGRGLESER